MESIGVWDFLPDFDLIYFSTKHLRLKLQLVFHANKCYCLLFLRENNALAQMI